MKYFDKNWHNEKLRKYYIEKFGEKEDDVWCEQPAVNVWVFRRGDKIITLKSDMRSEDVIEYIDQIKF